MPLSLLDADLPLSVRNNLPSHAQDMYRTAFNDAYENHAHDPIEEADAHNIAWAAVKRSYVKRKAENGFRGASQAEDSANGFSQPPS